MISKQISIQSDKNLSLTAKLFSKENRTEAQKGLLIYFHGGGLVFGTYDDLPKPYIEVLTEQFDVLLVSYSLIPESTLDDIFIDIKHIYDYASSLNENIYVFGRSAGGYLSYIMCKYFDVKGTIIFYGYYHFDHHDFNALPLDQSQYSHLLSPSIEKMNVREHPTVYEPPNPRFLLYLYYRHHNLWKDKLQVDLKDPTYFLTDDDLRRMPKTFLVHAANDPDVPYQYSLDASKLISTCKLITLNLNVHDFDREVSRDYINIYREMIHYFNEKN